MTDAEPRQQPARAQPAGSFPNAWTLCRVQGIPVRIDWSWLLMAGYVGFFLYTTFAGRPGPADPLLTLALAVAGTALFTASILAHELGHALTSLDRNIPVLSITMFALGGVTESTREADRARDEFVIVGIGPFISLVLAAAFGLVAAGTIGLPYVAGLAGVLAVANLILAIFNIVPGYPLDGGRLLRSVLWGITGDPHKSTRWAARVGQAFAATLVLVGLVGFTGGDFRWAPGFLRVPLEWISGGLWTLLIGIFLFQGATSSYKRARLREQLNRTSVRDVMGSVPPPLPAQWNLARALDVVQERPSLLWPVGDPVVGTLVLGQIDAVPSDLWDTTTVEDIALAADVTAVPVDTPLDKAVERMANAPHNMIVVTDAGRAVGLLTPSLVSATHH
ncbi:MAG: CBS domain-containing protein [Nitriliruptorales bacterium]|nr:CBS domain-containing protein [Nitriliruptorales bacterium]